jgi:hypothetical protein
MAAKATCSPGPAADGNDLELEEESIDSTPACFPDDRRPALKHAAICWDVFRPEPVSVVFESWQHEATTRYEGLITLIEAVHSYPPPRPAVRMSRTSNTIAGG